MVTRSSFSSSMSSRSSRSCAPSSDSSGPRTPRRNPTQLSGAHPSRRGPMGAGPARTQGFQHPFRWGGRACPREDRAPCVCWWSRTRSGWRRRSGAGSSATASRSTSPWTATDGLWMARENEYDAIVLDLMLPGMNGFQVCRRLREAEVWTPILVLTAKDGELDEAEALDTGADGYLTKPFSHVVLVAHLRALVRRATPARPSTLVAGDLRIDPSSRRCWRGEDEVALTAREFSVLEYLARHPGDVLSKRDILDARLGRRLPRAIPTSSRCTSATCAARSTSRSAASPSRPCGARGTGSGCKAAEVRRLGSVRVRTTIGATVVVGLALLVGAFALDRRAAPQPHQQRGHDRRAASRGRGRPARGRTGGGQPPRRRGRGVGGAGGGPGRRGGRGEQQRRRSPAPHRRRVR